MRGAQLEREDVNPCWKLYTQDAYFLRKGIVTMSLEEYRNLPQSYISRIFIILTESDEIAKEKSEKEFKKGR